MRNVLLLGFFILFESCSTKKEEAVNIDSSQRLQAQEENVSNTHWMLNPHDQSCVRFSGTVDEMTTVFEQVGGGNCSVALKHSPDGALRKFECGNMLWIVSDSEKTCQDFIAHVNRQEMQGSTYMMIPNEKDCDRYPGTISDMVQFLQTQTGAECIASSWGKKGLVTQIQCGPNLNWLVSENPHVCQELQKDFNAQKITDPNRI